MEKHCKNCGNKMADKRGGAKFCCLECKNAYNYKNRNEKDNNTAGTKINPLDLTLKGLAESEFIEGDGQDKASQKDAMQKSKDEVDAEFFNGLMSENIINVGTVEPDEQTQDKSSQQENEGFNTGEAGITLPEKYLTTEVQVNNPAYQIYESNLSDFNKKKELLEAEFKKLMNELVYHEGRTGDAYVWTGGIGAGLLAILNNSDKRKDGYKEGKKEKETNSGFWELLFKVAVFSAIGTGAGYVAKTASQGWREKDKQEKMTAIKRRVEEINQEYKTLLNSISFSKSLLGITPKLKIVSKKEINPEYTKALGRMDFQNVDLNQQEETKGIPAKNTPPFKFKSDKIIKASDVGKMEYRALNFKGLWKDFFGLPSINFHCLIHGNSGEGKSTFCIWFARYLAENFGRVLYVTGEEGVNMTFRDKLKFCEAEVENLHVLDVRTGDEFMKEVGQNEFHFIILDSLHDMEIDAKKMKEIFNRYKNSAFICIDQNNKKGELLGANEKKHICDIVVNVKDYVAETTKNRFKTKGMVYKTEDFTLRD